MNYWIRRKMTSSLLCQQIPKWKFETERQFTGPDSWYRAGLNMDNSRDKFHFQFLSFQLDTYVPSWLSQFNTNNITQGTMLHHMLVMDQDIRLNDSNKSKANEKVQIREIDNREKSNKCNQCEYASSQTSHLKSHLKRHSGEEKKKMQPMWICIFVGKGFEYTFENT